MDTEKISEWWLTLNKSERYMVAAKVGITPTYFSTKLLESPDDLRVREVKEVIDASEGELTWEDFV